MNNFVFYSPTEFVFGKIVFFIYVLYDVVRYDG